MLRDFDEPRRLMLEDEEFCSVPFSWVCPGCGDPDCNDPACQARQFAPCGGCYGCLRDGGCSCPVCAGCGYPPAECACWLCKREDCICPEELETLRADLATALRERDERQDAYSSALVKLGKTLRRTEDLERELAEAQAEMSRANREREAENLRAFRLEARLFDLGPTPCPHRTERALMGPHGVGCECAESDRWGKPFVVRTMQEIEAENARLRAALSALLVATRRLKLRQGVMEAAEAALREGGAA